MNFNGKRASAMTHFYDTAAYIKSRTIQKEWATESTFDHVVKVVQSAIDFNAEELINYERNITLELEMILNFNSYY